MDELVSYLRHVLKKRSVSEEDIEDYIQESFIRLEIYRRKKTVENERAFLSRIVINLWLDECRRRKRVAYAPESVENYEIADNSPQPEEVFASRRRLHGLSEGFKEMDPLTAQIVQAQRVEGLAVKAIAQRHNLSVGAVEKRLVKGLTFLTEWMKGW